MALAKSVIEQKGGLAPILGTANLPLIPSATGGNRLTALLSHWQDVAAETRGNETVNPVIDSAVQNIYLTVMARPKEFDRDAALTSAMEVFWSCGYEGASTDELLLAMQIGRQSMYDTFGDKHRLFLEALRCYHRLNGDGFAQESQTDLSPLGILAEFLGSFARRSEADNARGCMGINATTAFGQTNPEVIELAKRTARVVEGILERCVIAAQSAGELSPRLDPRRASRFLYANLQGLTVRAQAGASPSELDDAAGFAIEAIQAMT